MLDSFAKDVEKFFDDLGRDMGELADALFDFSEEVAEHIADAMTPDLERLDHQVDEWLDPVMQAILSIEQAFEETTAPLTHTVEPLLNQHSVCVGCKHYHGQSYNGVMLVCGMHPYGVSEESETCPDKELYPWMQHDSFNDSN